MGVCTWWIQCYDCEPLAELFLRPRLPRILCGDQRSSSGKISCLIPRWPGLWRTHWSCSHNWIRRPRGYPQTGGWPTGATRHPRKVRCCNQPASPQPSFDHLLWAQQKPHMWGYQCGYGLLLKWVLKKSGLGTRTSTAKKRRAKKGKSHMHGDWGIQAVTLMQYERPGCNALAQGQLCGVSLSNSSKQKEEVWTTHVFSLRWIQFPRWLALLNTTKTEFILLPFPQKFRILYPEGSLVITQSSHVLYCLGNQSPEKAQDLSRVTKLDR